MLTLNSLSKTFGHTKAVDSVSLTIERGSFVGVIGRSGAGRSTLLRMINRLNEPTSGSIVFEGSNIAELSGTELREWRRRCAMIFQQFNLVGRLDEPLSEGAARSVKPWNADQRGSHRFFSTHFWKYHPRPAQLATVTRRPKIEGPSSIPDPGTLETHGWSRFSQKSGAICA